MIDDLTSKGIAEPYRMFTSRAEFRLSLRADNADDTVDGHGLRRWASFRLCAQGAMRQQREALDTARALAKALTVTPNEARKHGLDLNQDGVRRSAFDLLAHPNIDLMRLRKIWPELGAIDAKTGERLETEAQYAVYLNRQAADAAVVRREESRAIPGGLDFSSLPGLSNELKQKMRDRQPRSIAEAQRMDGMTPAALGIILAHIRYAEGEDRKGAA